MTNDLGHGRRLSGEEYDRQVIALHRHASLMPTKKEDAVIRRRELDLAIDYRLGVEFPQERREALWAAMQQVEKGRLWLALKYGLRTLFSRGRVPKGLRKEANALVGTMMEACAGVLNERELTSFFELEDGMPVELPDDVER